MRVLHLGSGNTYGGIERTLVLYAEGKAAVTTIEPHFGVLFPGQLETELRMQGADVTVLGPARLSRPWSVRRARHALTQLMVNVRPAVVVTHGTWVHSVLGAVPKRLGIPSALFLHGPARTHWIDMLARQWKPDLVITNSSFTRARSAWWLGSTPTAVCALPLRRPEETNRAEERRKLGIDAETVVVLQVSRLEPNKGQHLHLEALAKIKADPRWRAIFVGGPQPGKLSYARYLLDLRERLGIENRVQFLGHRQDVPKLLAAADIFCQANISPEGFGIIFVEAMFAELPIVTTQMGAAQEILDSTFSKLIPPVAEVLAEALLALIGNPNQRQTLGRKGKAVAMERYTLERGVRELGHQLLKIAQSSTGTVEEHE